MKKIIAATVLATSISTAVFADIATMTGPYIGIHGGYGLAKAGGLKVDGALGGIHTGFQKDKGSVAFAIELEGGLTGQKYSKSGDHFKRLDYIGAAVRYAAKIQGSSLLYIKLGWQNSAFELKVAGDKEKKRLNAFVPGVGLEFLLVDRVLLGVEWSYAMFPRQRGFNEIRSSDVKARLGYKF